MSLSRVVEMLGSAAAPSTHASPVLDALRPERCAQGGRFGHVVMPVSERAEYQRKRQLWRPLCSACRAEKMATALWRAATR